RLARSVRDNSLPGIEQGADFDAYIRLRNKLEHRVARLLPIHHGGRFDGARYLLDDFGGALAHQVADPGENRVGNHAVTGKRARSACVKVPTSTERSR